MTLTLPVINAAQRVVFLIVGAEKAATLRAVLDGKTEPPYPAQLVQPQNGARLFLVDEAAGALLVSNIAPPAKPARGKPLNPAAGKPGRST